MSGIAIFGFGCLGGILTEVVHLFTLRKSLARRIPVYLKSWVYWLVTIMMILCGGSFTLVNFYHNGASPILAMEIGALAPILIHRMSQIGKLTSDQKSVAPGHLNWLSVLRGE